MKGTLGLRLRKTASLNIRTKLILLFCASILLPLILITQVVLSISEQKIKDQALTITVGSVNQNLGNVASLLGRYANICNRYSYHDEIINALSLDQDYDDPYSSFQSYKRVENIILNDAITKDFQITMRFYYVNDSFTQDVVNFIHLTDELRSSRMYQQTVQANGQIVWRYENGKLALSKIMRDYQGVLLGIIYLEIPGSEISSLIDNYKPEEMQVMIVDGEGVVLSSNNRTINGTSIEAQNYYRAGRGDGLQQAGFLSFRNRFNQDDASLPEWDMVTLVPMNRINSESSQVRRKVLLIGLISLFVSCALFLSILSRLTSRIKNLVARMRQVGEGNFLVVDGPHSNDEIGAITRNFNKMSESLRQLFYENIETKLQLKDIAIKKREAELYALQSQVHPHFLFNTLESIRMKLHKSNVEDAGSMIVNLSRLLRKSLNWKREIIPLSEEIEFVRSYLEIQRYRFKEKLAYEIDIPEHLHEYPIPKLIIQPIVENAIKHGIEKKWGGGIVVVSAAVQGSRIHIRVEDNGSGMEADTLAFIKSSLNSPEVLTETQIGIKNIHERVALHYGGLAHMDIESVKDRGTAILLTLPLLPELEQA